MTRYRIVQQPSRFSPHLALFAVEEWQQDAWQCILPCHSLKKAEQVVLQLVVAGHRTVETKVVREYEA